jgi:hypothetical protein
VDRPLSFVEHRFSERPKGVAGRDGQPCGAAGGASRIHSAARAADRPDRPWALRLAKRAVNHTMDTMGFSNAIESCFDMHHLGHTRALATTAGRTVVMADLDRMKAAGRPE